MKRIILWKKMSASTKNVNPPSPDKKIIVRPLPFFKRFDALIISSLFIRLSDEGSDKANLNKNLDTLAF